MSVKRFLAATSREAMRQVRATLGDSALILSNRRVAEGVEVLALAEDDHDRMTGVVSRDVQVPSDRSRNSAAAAYQRQAPASPIEPPSSPPPPPAVAAPQPDFAAFSERILGEMQDLRALVASQAKSVANSSATQGDSPYERLRQQLLGAGFSSRLTQELLENLPVELLTAEEEVADAWLERQLSQRLPMLVDEAALLDGGGVFALVGPTGIGKTTTTAKLAARYVMRHGGAGVALVTTDSYRIGAHEQLRIYARLLGVEVHALEADAPLADLLAQLADKRLVIIDTVGMSQRDQRLVGQVAMLSDTATGEPSRPVRRLLLLNAASHGDTLEEVVETYQSASLAAGGPLYGAILTKVDEAPRLGAVLDIAIRHGLRLQYVSHGQKVPEDLRLADSEALVRQALSVKGASSFAAEVDDGQGTPPARRLQALSRGLLGQGRALASTLAVLRRETPGFGLLEQAWPLLGYPIQQQQAQLPAILDKQNLLEQQCAQETPSTILWARAAPVSGVDWSLPAFCLNAAGKVQAVPWLAHRQPVGDEQRLDWAASELGIGWQLLPSYPGKSARDSLMRSGCDWLAVSHGNFRVMIGAERHVLSTLIENAEARLTQTCRYRGREASLALSRLPIELTNGESRDAWFGTLREVDSGRQLTLRYWLTPQHTMSEQRLSEAMVAQLVHDDLPLLARRAWQRLGETAQRQFDPELRLLVAASLAALASRLDQENAAWSMDVRAHLLGLLGGRRSRSPNTLLEALLHLLTARDAFLLLGNTEQTGRRRH